MTKTLKVFISQPMKGLQREDILKTRGKEFLKFCEAYYKDAALRAENGEQVEDVELELLDSFNDTPCDNPEVVHDRVFYLGRSVMKLAEADILYITQDALLQNSPGCLCELRIASTYGYPVYTLDLKGNIIIMNHPKTKNEMTNERIKEIAHKRIYNICNESYDAYDSMRSDIDVAFVKCFKQEIDDVHALINKKDFHNKDFCEMNEEEANKYLGILNKLNIANMYEFVSNTDKFIDKNIGD